MQRPLIWSRSKLNSFQKCSQHRKLLESSPQLPIWLSQPPWNIHCKPLWRLASIITGGIQRTSWLQSPSPHQIWILLSRSRHHDISHWDGDGSLPWHPGSRPQTGWCWKKLGWGEPRRSEHFAHRNPRSQETCFDMHQHLEDLDNRGHRSNLTIFNACCKINLTTFSIANLKHFVWSQSIASLEQPRSIAKRHHMLSTEFPIKIVHYSKSLKLRYYIQWGLKDWAPHVEMFINVHEEK